MSRTQTQGIEYFPMAVDFFSDKKVKVLKSRFGADGVEIYLYLLCQIYREGFYTHVDDDFVDVASDDLGMSPEKVHLVMAFFLERSMFDEQLFKADKVITGPGIQERWQNAVAMRAQKTPMRVDARYWLLDEADTRPFIKVTHQQDSSEKNDDSSEKNGTYFGEETPNKSKVYIPPYIPPRGRKKKGKATGDADARNARERYYALLRRKAEDEAERVRAIAGKDATFREADAACRKGELDLARAEVYDPSSAEVWRTALSDARRRRREALARLGLSEESLLPQYRCKKCSDSGFLPDGRSCNCYKGQ